MKKMFCEIFCKSFTRFFLIVKFYKGRKWIRTSMLSIFFKKSNNFTCTEMILTFNIDASNSLLTPVMGQRSFCRKWASGARTRSRHTQTPSVASCSNDLLNYYYYYWFCY